MTEELSELGSQEWQLPWSLALDSWSGGIVVGYLQYFEESNFPGWSYCVDLEKSEKDLTQDLCARMNSYRCFHE